MEPNNLMESSTENGHPNGTGQSKLQEDLAALAAMGIAQLRLEYVRVFGEASLAHNRLWLVRRIAWRIQALAEGDLSERARDRAADLANDADLRLTPPSRKPANGTAKRPGRFPTNGLIPGTILNRTYKGMMLEVKVLAEGFEYQGSVYRSLSALAKTITGSHCSGCAFFKIGPNGDHK
jgi:hypothetical protein